MPTYTYECKDCGHRYDNFQSMSAPADTECPQCKGRVERVIGGGSGIVFKGSGFYVTDYKKDSGSSGGQSGSSGSSGKSTTGGGASSGSDSSSSSSSGGGSTASASASSSSASGGSASKSD